MNSSSVSFTPVLIIGGGPSGLTLAGELLRRGVRCRIIDRLEGPTATSRAFTLHARTLELFEMAGIADRFLERGLCNIAMDYHFQSVGETVQLLEVLREHLATLGAQVEWGTALRSF